MDFESDDLSQIELNELRHQLRGSKASRLVPALLFFGHRNIAGSVSERQRSMVIGAGML
jgi:hypothetical protein